MTRVAASIFVTVMVCLSSFVIAASDRLFLTKFETSFTNSSRHSIRTS